MIFILLILYGIIAAVYFSFIYTCLDKLNQRRNSRYTYRYDDALFDAVILSVFWPVTMWFAIPYCLINLTENKERAE